MAENTTTNTLRPPRSVALTVIEEKNKDIKIEIPEPTKKKTLKSVKLRHVVLPLALITFLLSIPLGSIWLLYVRQYDCEDIFKSLPRIQNGIAIGLIILFFLSNGVVYVKARFSGHGLIVVMIPLVLFFIVGLGLGGSFNTRTSRIPATPKWLNIKVHKNNNWNSIKSCLYDTYICRDLVSRSYDLRPYDFSTEKLSSIESGCCQPPSACEMEFVNATYWKKNDLAADADIPHAKDCDQWQNDETLLCYDCHECNQGFVKTLEGKWLQIGTFLVAMSVLLMISHVLLFVATAYEKHLA